jgi:hypothetical protein
MILNSRPSDRNRWLCCTNNIPRNKILLSDEYMNELYQINL